MESWDGALSLGEALRSFLPLCGAILFKPVVFFTQLASASPSDAKKRLRSAVIFALILSYIKLALDLLNLFWFRFFAKEILPMPEALEVSLISGGLWTSPFFLLRPLVVLGITLVFVMAGVKLVLGFDKPLIPALWVVCFRSASDLFYCIPFVGSIVAVSWGAALLVVGLRQVYKIGTLRSALAGILLPSVILLSVLLAMGPALNRAILSLYPEMKSQVVKINDVTAYAYTSAISSAAQAYKKDLGFFPAHLGVLSKYLSSSVVDDALKETHPGGYTYRYERVDDQHFLLEARPVEMGLSGRLVFYSDETGLVRLDGPQGIAIKNTQELEGHI